MTRLHLRQKLEQHLATLPLLPSVVAELMSLDRRDDQYFDRVLKIVEAEPNFSARILAAANSALRASREPVTTLRSAIARTGSENASDLVLGFAITRVFVPRDPWEKSLWRHAIQVAVAARELARRGADPDVTPDEAYTCGLLHDVGRFVMFQEAPEELRRVDEGSWTDPEGLVAMEESICGVTHAELGALACAKWGLPQAITEVVRDHHAVIAGPPVGKIAKLVALVRVADLAMFPSAIPGSRGLEEADDDTLREEVQRWLPAFVPLDLHELRELLREAAEEAAATAEALHLA